MTELEIGDRVTYRNRAFVVRGFAPMSVQPQTVLLEDPTAAGKLVAALPEELDDEDAVDAAA